MELLREFLVRNEQATSIYKGQTGELQIRKLFCLLGPGLSDDVTKSQNVILRFGPKSHTNRGNRKIRNADWENYFLSMIDITDSYTYPLLVYLGDDAFETLWNFFLWHVSSFYSSHSKHAMPFQQQHSFYRWGKFMSTCSRHRPALCHRQLTHERAHLFLLKSNDGRFCNVSACAWGFIPTSVINFPHLRRKIAPCKKFELHLTLAKPAVVVLSSLQTARRTLKTSKSASIVFPSFFMSHTK